jgi:4-amino-4-deoxy-L-arabinose transferase-like glycosyltransferase
VTLERLALGLTVAAFVLAGVAILARQGVVTYVAIGFAAAAMLLRWRLRRRGSP